MGRNRKNANHIYRVDKFKVPAAAREEFLARVRPQMKSFVPFPDS
jgi:hypothetical protein